MMKKAYDGHQNETHFIHEEDNSEIIVRVSDSLLLSKTKTEIPAFIKHQKRKLSVTFEDSSKSSLVRFKEKKQKTI